DASPTRIVRSEILKGLPGEGPVPKHFHLGHPTPWSEGFVVRFCDDSEREWIGNFQRGVIGLNTVLEWPEADVMVVFANGACYILPKGDPDGYQTHGSNAMYSMFDEKRSPVFIAYEDGDLVAFDQSGCEKWARQSFGAFGVVLKSRAGGILTGEI